MWKEIEIIRELLEKERAWRSTVFSGRTRTEKVAEIDQALAALERVKARLQELGMVVDPPRQMELL